MLVLQLVLSVQQGNQLSDRKNIQINVLEYNFITGVGKFVNNNGTLNTAASTTDYNSLQRPISI